LEFSIPFLLGGLSLRLVALFMAIQPFTDVERYYICDDLQQDRIDDINVGKNQCESVMRESHKMS